MFDDGDSDKVEFVFVGVAVGAFDSIPSVPSECRREMQ